MRTTTAPAPYPRVNRYRAPCVACGALVPARGGTLTQTAAGWEVRHLACADAEPGSTPHVVEFYSPSSGWRGTQNARSRCIDAPCCGCCTC